MKNIRIFQLKIYDIYQRITLRKRFFIIINQINENHLKNKFKLKKTCKNYKKKSQRKLKSKKFKFQKKNRKDQSLQRLSLNKSNRPNSQIFHKRSRNFLIKTKHNNQWSKRGTSLSLWSMRTMNVQFAQKSWQSLANFLASITSASSASSGRSLKIPSVPFVERSRTQISR